MYSTNDLQKLVQMLSFLGVSPGSAAPAHSVVFGAGTYGTPGVAGTLLASNGAAADPSFQTLAALGIQPAGTYAPLPLPASSVGASQLANNAVTDIAVAAAAAIQSSKLSYNQGATGAVARSIQEKFQDEIWLTDFGADPTGATDSLAAWNSAIAAAVAGRKRLRIGPGKFSLSAAVSFTFPATTGSLIIEGSGVDITEITFPNVSSGITLNYDGPFNSVHIRDLSITTGQVAAGTAAIGLTQTVGTILNPALTALSDITNVTIRGADGYEVTDYWSYGVVVNSVSNINFTSLMIVGSGAQLGYGVLLEASGANAPPVIFNFTGCWIGYVQFGVAVSDFVQGVTINQSNFFACQNGFVVAAGVTGLDQLTIANSQFACNVNINMASQFQNAMIIGNLFIIITNGFGIFYSAAVLFTIVGNTFQNGNSGTGETGIYINNTTGGVAGVITGNVFRALADAIKLDTASSGVNVQSNFYAGMTSHNVNNLGAGNTIGGGSA
jgi:hypothetical protein